MELRICIICFCCNSLPFANYIFHEFILGIKLRIFPGLILLSPHIIAHDICVRVSCYSALWRTSSAIIIDPILLYSRNIFGIVCHIPLSQGLHYWSWKTWKCIFLFLFFDFFITFFAKKKSLCCIDQLSLYLTNTKFYQIIDLN